MVVVMRTCDKEAERYEPNDGSFLSLRLLPGLFDHRCATGCIILEHSEEERKQQNIAWLNIYIYI